MRHWMRALSKMLFSNQIADGAEEAPSRIENALILRWTFPKSACNFQLRKWLQCIFERSNTTGAMRRFRYFNWEKLPPKFDICHQVHISTLAKNRLKKVAPDELILLHEDAFIVVVDKPPHILSLPGKCTKPFFKPRHEQWRDAVCMAACGEFETRDSDLQRHLQRVEQLPSIPRKKIRFQKYISGALKIVDIQMQESIWRHVSDADDFLNKQPFKDIPHDLVSTADLVEKYCGHKVFVVHRLDFETSGVILYAKTESCAADLCRQFRDREVEWVSLFTVKYCT